MLTQHQVHVFPLLAFQVEHVLPWPQPFQACSWTCMALFPLALPLVFEHSPFLFVAIVWPPVPFAFFVHLPFSHSDLFQSSLLLFPISIFCFSSLVFLVIALKRWDLSVAVNAGMTSEVLSWSGETWTWALSYKSQFCCYSYQACRVLKGVLTPLLIKPS